MEDNIVNIEHTGMVRMSDTFHTTYLGPILTYNVAITILQIVYYVVIVRGIRKLHNITGIYSEIGTLWAYMPIIVVNIEFQSGILWTIWSIPRPCEWLILFTLSI